MRPLPHPNAIPPSCNQYLTALSRRIVTAASTTPNAAIARRSTAIPCTSMRCTCWAYCATSKASTPKPPTLVRRAVNLRPEDAALQLNLGNALKALGQIDDAIEQFRNALTLAPSFPMAHYNLGNAYASAGPPRRRRRRVREVAAPATARRVVA